MTIKDSHGYTVSFGVDQREEIQQFFDKYGFVVVKEVLTEKDCKATLDDILYNLIVLN